MKTDFNLRNIINDYLQGRLSEADHLRFINLYSHLVRQDPRRSSAVFDDIHEQVEALSDEELEVFIEMMSESKHPNNKTWRSKMDGLSVWVKLAAAIVLIASISFLIFHKESKHFKLTIYKAKYDKMIWLPDSSSVYMKAGSTIRLMENYGIAKRELLMEGEAFFYVKPDSTRPFVVKAASGFYSQVLGTSFSMYATPEMCAVDVETGKVQVGDSDQIFAVLMPGDQIRRDANGIVSLDRSHAVSAEATFQFTEQRLQDISQQLEEYYSAEIVLTGESIGELEYTATFSRSQSLEEIVSVLCELHDLKYELKENQIIITNH